MYIARESKGHKGIQGAPLENYLGTVIHLGDWKYLDVPPNDYYREGYNLCKRLRMYKESELNFLFVS